MIRKLTLIALLWSFGLPGCQILMKADDPSKASSSKTAPERGAILDRYSYMELFAASELLNQVITQPANFPTAEGEGSFGCRLEPASASRWLAALRPLIDEKQIKERDAYLENPSSYKRKAGFERCAPNCSCRALGSVIQKVKMKDLKSPQLRSTHREYLRKLDVKASRMDPEEEQACIYKQVWFCTSDLRDFLDGVKAGTQASTP